jgi:HD superfamily phosphodiesterase
MEKKFEKIWELALPYLKKGKRKDFVLHTKGVIRAVESLLKEEKGDANILIPAAILHDVGWAKVPTKLQMSDAETEKTEALELHLEYAVPIIEEILAECGYNKSFSKKIADVVLAHKFKNPRRSDKRLLIDADTLADVFKEQFASDIEAYKTTAKRLFGFRSRNKFYTKTAKSIFQKELDKRKKEFLP